MAWISQISFIIILAVAVYLLSKRISKIKNNISSGKDLDRTDQSGNRWKTMLLVAFGQKKMFKNPIPALLHLFVYVGFLVINIEVLEFIKVLKLSGIPSWRIFLFHVIPNSYRPALINMSFVMASLLIVESTLSFIGVGLPSELITWGKILAGFKVNTSNWWTVAFPGIIIFCTILSLHRLRRWMAQVIEH